MTTVTISWQPPAVEDVETDHELYLLLAAFDPDELSNVLVYRGDSVEGGAVALERLHREYGE